jgi:hypothetical protein
MLERRELLAEGMTKRRQEPNLVDLLGRLDILGGDQMANMRRIE